MDSGDTLIEATPTVAVHRALRVGAGRIADGQAHRLYAQDGVVPTAPASVGMALVR